MMLGSRVTSPHLRIAVISQAYHEPEVFKNISTFSQYAAVLLIGPEASRSLIFEGRELSKLDEDRLQVRPLRTLRFNDAQYLLLGLKRSLKHFNPDVVIIEYDPWAIISCQALRALDGLPHGRPDVVFAVKKNTLRRSRISSSIKRAVASKVLSNTLGVLAASQRTADLYVHHLGFPPARVTVQPRLGVDPSAFYPRTRDNLGTLTVGFIGRISTAKGVTDLVHACSLARSRLAAPLRLVLQGPSDPSVPLETLASPWIEVRQPVNNSLIPSALRRFDIFVMPARVLPDHEEHDGRALLEAMMTGLPCIGTASGIISELLHEDVGLLVAPEDIQGLADALVQLGNSAEERERLGEFARARAVAQATLQAVASSRIAAIERWRSTSGSNRYERHESA